jgi:hypothetical protein
MMHLDRQKCRVAGVRNTEILPGVCCRTQNARTTGSGWHRRGHLLRGDDMSSLSFNKGSTCTKGTKEAPSGMIILGVIVGKTRNADAHGQGLSNVISIKQGPRNANAGRKGASNAKVVKWGPRNANAGRKRVRNADAIK